MANAQLGSFSYDLLLKVASFEDAFTKAQRIAEKNANDIRKTIEKAGAGIGDTFKEIAGAAVAAFSVEKLIEYGHAALEMADNVGKAAQKVGVSTEALSALNVQAQLSNVAIDSLQGGMEKLAKNAAAAAGGNKQSAADFAAIGVAVKDTNGQLRPMQDILGDVAKKFSTYQDSAAKTALAQQLFGKSGADLIPVLNDLGDKGFAGATEQAKKFGLVISGETAKQAEEFNDTLTMIGMETKGFALSVMKDLLPAITNLAKGMEQAGETTDNYASSSGVVSNAIKGVIAAFVVAKEVVAAGATTIFAWFDAVKVTFNSAGAIVSAWASSTSEAIGAALHFDSAGVAKARADFKTQFDSIASGFTTSMSGIKEGLKHGFTDAISNSQTAITALFGATEQTAKGMDHAADSARHLHAPIVAMGDAADKAAAQVVAAAEAVDALQKLVTSIQGKAGDPVDQAIAIYQNEILALQDAAEKAAIAGADVGKVLEMWRAGEEAAAEQFAKTTQQIQEQSDILGRFRQSISDQTALIGLTDRELAMADASKKVTEEFRKLEEEGKKPAQSLEDLQKGARDAAAGLYDLQQRAKLTNEAAKEWQGVWSNAGNSIADTFAKVVVEGGSLFDSLKNIAKQTVEQIIAYFARLAVINPILNSIFGGGGGMGAGFSLLPTLANTAFGGGGGGASMVNAAVNGGTQNVLGSGGATGGGAGGFSLFSPSTWITAGKNIWQGFTGAGNAFAGAQAGAFTSAGGGTGAFLGAHAGGSVSTAGGGFFTPGGGSFGGYTSGFGQALGVAGSIYAGYNRYQQAGGGIGGVAGAAAYGVGTYFAGAAVSTALAGGLSAGLAAIPVVGWIALAAMLIDKFSGGKLFGTKWQTKASTTSLAIGPDGGDASASLYQTKQGAFFSGLKKQTKSVDPGQDARDAANQLFDSVKQTMVQAAHQLQIEVPPVIKAALDVVNTYDKKGKVTSTKYVVDILGKKYEEASQELAATRISAEAIVATVAASEAGKAASTIAERWRKSADTLMDGAQFLVAATADITKGLNLLGDGGTLTQIADIVGELQQGSEKLVDTYQRLGTETKVIQAAFAVAGVAIGKTGADLVRFADQAASAAGGADQLSQIVAAFNQAYFSPAEIAKASADQLKKASDSALTAIGENPFESMAKFKEDFLKALPNLSPEDLEKWYAAGIALASYTGAVTDSANKLMQAKGQYAQFELQLYGDDFVSSFAAVVAAEQNQIDTANALAKAAGKAGASQQDLARITAQGSIAIGKAMAQLSQGINDDIAALSFNTFGADANNPFAPWNQSSQQNAAAQQQAQKQSAAYDLIEKLGNYSFASGKSTADVLKQFNLSPAEIAATLGISIADVNKGIESAKDSAAALTTMAAQGDEQVGLLSDILAALQNKPLPYDISQLGTPTPIDLTDKTTTKPGGNRFAAPIQSKEMAQAFNEGNKPSVDEQKRTNDLLEKLIRTLGDRGTSNRNTAGRPVYFANN